MTPREWARFAGAYFAGVLAFAVVSLLYNGLLDGWRRPYHGVNALAVGLAPMFIMHIAFGRPGAVDPTRLSGRHVAKVMAALVVLGAAAVVLVEAVTWWETDWPFAAVMATLGAVAHPQLRAHRERKADASRSVP